MTNSSLVQARALRKEYGRGDGLVRAVTGSTSTSPQARAWR
jgi:hypothetical protein